MANFITQVKSLNSRQISVIAAIGTVIIAGIILALVQYSNSGYDVLYSNLEKKSLLRVSAELDKMGKKYKVIKESILVESTEVMNLRLMLADKIEYLDSSIGYQIFDEDSKMTETNFEQQVKLLRAIEGELAKTISSIDNIITARVHLVVPKRKLFSKTSQKPKASVYIKTANKAKSLDEQQAFAIQKLVAFSVSKLQSSDVSIIDERGKLLSKHYANPYMETVASREDLKRQKELQISDAIEELLSNVVGIGKVRAQVTLNMNFEEVISKSQVFDPDGKVLRSENTISNNSVNKDSKPSVSVQNNLPDNQNQNNEFSSQNNNIEEQAKYEISNKIIKKITNNPQIKQLSVAVLIDGKYQVNKNERVYIPRTEEELNRLTLLIKSAIGFDAKRNDNVELINMQFDDNLYKTEAESWFAKYMSEATIISLSQTILSTIIAIFLLLFIVKPIVDNAFSGDIGKDSALEFAEKNMETFLQDTTDKSEEDENAEYITIKEVDTKIKSGSVKAIEKVINDSPEQVVSLLRTWLNKNA